jgi:hypothetical protein
MSLSPSDPTAAALPPKTRERIARYEAKAARLTGALRDYERRTPIYRKAFIAFTLSGYTGFAFGMYPGLWGALSTTVIGFAGYGMLHTRLWELRGEIAETVEEVALLRAGCVQTRRYDW